MPLYEYEVLDGPCRICGGKFELRRPADRPELTCCPLCKRRVRRLIGVPNLPKVTGPRSVSDAKAAGFSVLERRDRGVYERL
jgi:putative FmdB family regulatory protein